jgi:hypothetical protein
MVVVLAVSASACGKKASPKPPQDIAPAQVERFVAKGTVDGVQLTWGPPLTTANGGALVDLAGFVVWRSLVEEGRESDFERIAEIPYRSQDGVDKAAEQYSHLDSDVRPGGKYDYYISAFNQALDDGSPSTRLRVTYIGESSVVIGRTQS